MSPAVDPMTFDELSELYRVEMKSASLSQPRKDLYRAMANLLTSLRQEYDRQMSKDPDSVMTEGAEQRRKKADRLCSEFAEIEVHGRNPEQGADFLNLAQSHVGSHGSLVHRHSDFGEALQKSRHRRKTSVIDRCPGPVHDDAFNFSHDTLMVYFSSNNRRNTKFQ